MTDGKQKRMEDAYRIVERAGAGGATIAEIAKAMPVAENQPPMKVTPYLLSILDECVRIGWLYKEPSTIQTGRGARMGWRYFVTQEGT